jgi:hypothetical protein
MILPSGGESDFGSDDPIYLIPEVISVTPVTFAHAIGHYTALQVIDMRCE